MPSQISSGVEQFNMFARFAASASMSSKGLDTIARSDGVGAADGPHSPLHISTASDDKVYALRRSSLCKRANDDTRAVFMRAVSDMFNGNIPENVQKAMKLNDFHCGRPLTARRILAVREAVLAEAAARQIPDAIAAINRDQPKPGLQLTKDQMKLATELFKKHASVSAGMHSKNNDVLAVFIVRLVATPNLPKPPYSYLPNVAGPNSKFREFKPGDPRAQRLDEVIKKYLCDMVKECGQRHESFNGDDISFRFIEDADHGSYTIAGHTFVHGQSSAAEVVDAFKSAVKNPLHRKVLSAFMCQVSQEIPASAAKHQGVRFFPESAEELRLYTATDDVKMIIGSEFKTGNFCDFSGTPSYKLDIAPDGKSAKLTHVIGGKLRFDAAVDGDVKSNESFGTFTFTQEFTFDLSKEEPELTDYHIGQTFGV